jgi:very-short-patch-repair endonuclease
MSRIKLIPYNPKLKELARQLRVNSTKAEIILWKHIKGKSTGYQFHRQLPVDEFILDFYCHELKLAIEVDGYTHDYNYDYDELRQKKLEYFGITVIRFSDEDVKRHLTDVLRMVQSVVDKLEKKTSP